MTEPAIYVMEKMAHGFKRLGKAAQRGFYDYSDEPAQLWSGLKTFERRRKDIDSADILDRLRLAAVLASLNQDSPAPDSVRSHLGADLPGDRNQAQAWLARAGQPALQARSTQLSERYGARFTWPQANPSEHA